MTENAGSKGILPFGWVVKASKRYPDRVYYFNINTGSSTWECPELTAARPSIEGLDANTEDSDNKTALLKDVAKRLEKLQKQQISTPIESNSNFPDDLKPPSSENLKVCAPPTAVVVPVVHESSKQKKPLSVELDSDLPSTSKSVKKIKKSRQTSQESVLKKKKKSKKKISPLNRSDSEIHKKSKSKKGKIRRLNASDSSLIMIQEDREPSNHADLQKKMSPSKISEDLKNEEDDVEMQDVSMEVLEEVKSTKETVVDTFASYYIVVDTNVLISELHLINELKDTPVDGCGPPHIFIPWVVIQELDGLKSNKNAKNTMRAACEAIRYLNSVLGKHPRFHGQSPAEAESWAKAYSRCNDDRLLECCIALGDKMPKEKVILLTNDKNLVNKAIICNINVHDWKSMMNFVKPDVVFNLTKESKERSVSSSSCSKSKQNDEIQMIVHQRNVYEKEIHTIMATARQLLKNVLSEFVEQEMNRAYGSAWLFFPIERNFLEGMLLTIISYWKMVFSEILDQKQKDNIERLYKTATRPEGFYGDREDCLHILTMIEEVFVYLKKRRPDLNISVGRIKDFRTLCVDAFHTYCELDDSIKEAEKVATLGIFERNWSATNHLCGMVLDFCKIDHNFLYDKPVENPTEPEIRKLLCNLYPGVQQLKTLMFKIIDCLHNNKPTKKLAYKLHTALIKFIPSLEISYEAAEYAGVTAETINKFCIDLQNREMIEIGYRQIEKFFLKLDEALTALMAANFKKGCASPETMICD